ncbi:MAG: dCTP deaminase [Candidatus Nanopelagicales bacterium]
MLCADHQIRGLIEHGCIQVEPLDLSFLQPSSLDVRLGKDFKFYSEDATLIDPRKPQADQMRSKRVPWGGEFILPAHGFALGVTLEHLSLNDAVACRFEGKSSLGRLGLLPHVAAGFIDPGFSGWVTLELHNVTGLPMVLIPGMKIGQLCFFRLNSAVDVPYGSSGIGSKYQNQSGPTTSRYHLNF